MTICDWLRLSQRGGDRILAEVTLEEYGMSDLPPRLPVELGYQAAPPGGGVAFAIRLAVAGNMVMAAVDMVYGMVQICLGIFTPSMFRRLPGMGEVPAWVFAVAYCGVGLLGIGVAMVKVKASGKLLRRLDHAWGWGMAAGAIGCVQVWCAYFFVVPLLVGIFTLVILCQRDVRGYLRGVEG